MTEHAEPQQARYFHYRGRRTLEKKAGRVFNVLTQVFLIATLLVVMLLWGGRQPTGVVALAVGTLAASITWALSLACRGRWVWRHAGGCWLVIPVVLLGLLQLSGDFSALMMTDALKAVYDNARSTGLFKGEALLAVIPSEQGKVLLMLAAASLWYAIARQVFDTGRRALVGLAAGLVTVALIAGLIGILQRFVGYEWIGPVWMEPAYSASGTWANKNHFAQFEAMGLFLALGLLTSFTRVQKGSTVALTWSRNVRRGIAALAGLTVIVCAMGVLFSISRTATMLSGIALLLFLAYLLKYRLKAAFGPVAIGFFLIGFVVLVAGDYALSRLEFGLSGEDASGLVRYQIWQTALSVIGLAPLTGTGFAAMRGLNSHFDTSYMPGYVSFDAHNDYLDLAAMVGIPLAVLIVGWVLFFFVKRGLAMMKKESCRSSLHAVAVGAWLGLFCALGHEVMDYGFKYGANLVLALGLTVVMTGLVRRLAEDNKRELPADGHWSTPAEKEGAKVGRAFYGFPAALGVLAVLLMPALWQTGKLGLMTANLDNIREVPSMRAALTNAKWFNAIRRRTGNLTTVDPANFHAWEVDGLVSVRYGSALETDVMASSMARVLDRPVSPRQVWRDAYGPYREAAFRGISDEERQTVASQYDRAADAFAKAYAENPMNGLTLSRLAKAEDDAATWKRQFAPSLKKHETALKLFPANVEVKRNAINGYWRAWQETNDRTEKLRYEETLIELARDFALQVPYRLREIYPLIWSVKPEVGLLEELTPPKVSALEELGQFFKRIDKAEAALHAYENVIRVNALRADEETPETIGDLEFLKRDRRSKLTVERMTAERMVSLYEKTGRTTQAYAIRLHADSLLAQERTPEIEKIDRAMKESNYVLAESFIKPIKDDVRAKIRMAEILLLSGRYEGLRHWVADIKKIEEKKPLADEERIRLTSLFEQMDRLGVPVPEAHEFDLPDDSAGEQSKK